MTAPPDTLARGVGSLSHHHRESVTASDCLCAGASVHCICELPMRLNCPILSWRSLPSIDGLVR
jgi:hypothetical protein